MIASDRKEHLKLFQSILNYTFTELSWLNKALTHRSYVHEEATEGIKDNERLEFLGDAVIDLVIGDYFFKQYSSFTEGDLTKIRASLVNEITLSKQAKKLQMGDFILLGKGEGMTGGKEKSSILADVFEAVIAAIYLDSDFNTVYQKVICYFKEDINNIVPEKTQYIDYKSKLQEYTQRELSDTPLYRIVKETGPPHNKSFESAVIVNGAALGSGKGKSKKEAEQEAARVALLECHI